MICFVVVGIIISQLSSNNVFVPSSMIWPLNKLFFLDTGFTIHPVFILFVSSMSWQYIFHTLITFD